MLFALEYINYSWSPDLPLKAFEGSGIGVPVVLPPSVPGHRHLPAQLISPALLVTLTGSKIRYCLKKCSFASSFHPYNKNTIRLMCYYYPHFTKGNGGPGRLSDLPEVTQL